MTQPDLRAASADTTVFPLSTEERARERVLRERFADFWGTATGDMRTTYDAFIAASPLVPGAILEAVDQDGVRGWWVRPQVVRAGQAILFLHGGGYGLGSAQSYRGFVSQIVERTGVPALVIDYPLAPEATLPSAPAAALKAWDLLVRLGFGRIAIVGDSAGGGLSLVTLAQLVREGGRVRPVAGAVFSPWTDLTLPEGSMTDPAVVDPLISHEYLRNCADAYLGSFAATDPLASPLHGDLTGLPPLLIQVGTDERLLDDSRRYAQRAAQAGVPVRLEIWEGLHHVFQLDVAHLESSRAALDRAAAFLRDALES